MNMNLPKSIKSYQLMGESSYANSVLQAFIQLECFQQWIKLLNYNGNINLPFFNTSLTKDLYLLFSNIPTGILDSTKLILDFQAKIQELYHKNIAKDPFHFLFYFLDILHYESNMPMNPHFDLNTYNQLLFNNLHSDSGTFNLFQNYLSQTQNSFISNNFFNINKCTVACPNCQFMYTYHFTKIIRFNLDEILPIRNQLLPLKFGQIISLNDCFYCSKNQKKIQCQGCLNILASESRYLYEPSNVLIIAFNRNNNYNYQCDVKSYLDLDISPYLLNKNSENRKYFLKAIISCYGNEKYYADVLINGYFYRIMDKQTYPDVKQINVNQLMDFRPVLLIYEIDYTNKMMDKMQKLFTFAIQLNLQKMMLLNLNLTNNVQGFQNNDLNMTTNFITLHFKVIPQNWDGSENESFPINPQVTSESTVQYAIEKFYGKLQKPPNAIIQFNINNNNVLAPNSQEKIKDLNINENTIIYAIKSPNFDQLNLFND